jgi:hypothetical protein
VKAQRTKLFILSGLVAAASASCGDVATSSRAPAQLVITSLMATASTGGVPTTFPTNSGPLLSDVITNGSVFDDFGQVTMRLVLKDPGVPGVAAAPSALNQVTVTRYRVSYRRSNTASRPGIDVPQPFDGAVTFTVGESDVAAVFELVRHVAKIEAPLGNLVADRAVITTIADVTFYGRDQAGNDVSVTGSIQVSFADFADPTT